MATKQKVKSLATLRSGPNLNGEKNAVYSVRLFNRLIIIIEREIKTRETLMFELRPTPMSLFRHESDDEEARQSCYVQAIEDIC